MPELRVANALLAPFASALIAEAVARRRAVANPHVVPRNHVWFAFWFTVGLVAVRLAFGARG